MDTIEPKPGSAHDLIRVGVTLVTIAIAIAIAIALATFNSDSPLAPFFLLSGLAAAIGTGYAMAQLWEDALLTPRDLIPRRRPEGMDGRYEAIVYVTWGMIGFVTSYIAMLILSYN